MEVSYVDALGGEGGVATEYHTVFEGVVSVFMVILLKRQRIPS